MSAETAPEAPAEKPAGLLTIAAPATPEEGIGSRTPFTLPGDDDTVLWAVQPKAVMVAFAASALQQDDINIDTYRDLTLSCLDLESHNTIWTRLSVVNDELDLPHVRKLIEVLVEKWTARPTGGQPASAVLPRTTGKRSKGPSRSKGPTPTNSGPR